MAKRKRLEIPLGAFSPKLETKSPSPAPRARMPIADVAGDTAGRAALEEVAREMTVAQSEGRIVQKLPLDKIVTHHLARDRMVLDVEEMDALAASLAERGQQTPVEVVTLSGGRFGLISGLRRVEALRALGADHALALIKTPEDSQGAYRAMVEENEIRAGLSFYERANIAVVAVGQGVYPDPAAAVRSLFAHAPKAKRSKILNFVTVREALGRTLHFPAAIPEHLGLALAKALQADKLLAGRISRALAANPPADAAAERRILEAALKGPGAARPEREELAPGLRLEHKAGRAVLSGKAVDQAFLDALRAFAISHAKR